MTIHNDTRALLTSTATYGHSPISFYLFNFSMFSNMKKVVFAAMMALSCTFAFAGTNPVQTEALPGVQSLTQVTSVIKTTNAANELEGWCMATGGGTSAWAPTCEGARLLWLVRQCLERDNQGACDRI